jgi:hypothetical protein
MQLYKRDNSTDKADSGTCIVYALMYILSCIIPESVCACFNPRTLVYQLYIVESKRDMKTVLYSQTSKIAVHRSGFVTKQGPSFESNRMMRNFTMSCKSVAREKSVAVHDDTLCIYLTGVRRCIEFRFMCATTV